ncbi:ABC-2 type transporter [Patulibacter medicamentivorans]|uniref:ABC-2 type transporter n=1 Tax=Patulibacter medicamentivorans TaxID=1097667 RepID=H0E1B8_9ACTN|nr:hypothetical protein [Patulibacter medicamentivorans]EHN12557.1 ABC-2 type transporter [Patulibacter medicamentivorans]
MSTTIPVSRSRAALTLPAPSWWRALLALTRHGLHEQRRAPLVWGGALGAMSALMAAIWPTIEDSMSRMMDSYPEQLKQAFGIVRLDSVERYVDAEMLSLIVPLTLALLAVRCVTGPTVAAEARGYLDTMLALPLTRRVLAISSFIVAALVVAATLAVVWAMTMLAGVVAGTGMSAAVLGRGIVNVWPLAMVFAGVAVVAGGALRGSGRVTGIATGALLAMYVLDLVGKLAPSVDGLRTVSAFRYYGSAVQNGLDVSHVLGLTAVAVALAALGAELLQRRDVR